jgi:4-aminobutyrate aminotransferase-like enzyme
MNLETGSVAAEAALKLALSRFYRPQPDSPVPPHEGRVPVFLVVGDDQGELLANYHGTTIMAQTLRGMWPAIGRALARQELLLIRAVRPDDLAGFKSLLSQYSQGRYKVAALIHELILMNYGGTRLSPAFVRQAHDLCRAADVMTIVDEIQTGIWSPEVFLFREYGIRPDVVVVGKGFPGGEFAASRVLLSAAMDSLPQFGALVTNGQEELASLAYLITLRWVQANAEVIGQVGEYYEDRLRELAGSRAALIDKVEGRRHMAGIYFFQLDTAQAFVAGLNEAGIDISAQTYKEGCPPSALTKLPLVAGFEVVDWLLARMETVLGSME